MQRDKPCNISVMQPDKSCNKMNVVQRDKPCKISVINLVPSSLPHSVLSLAQPVLYSVITLARILTLCGVVTLNTNDSII